MNMDVSMNRLDDWTKDLFGLRTRLFIRHGKLARSEDPGFNRRLIEVFLQRLNLVAPSSFIDKLELDNGLVADYFTLEGYHDLEDIVPPMEFYVINTGNYRWGAYPLIGYKINIIPDTPNDIRADRHIQVDANLLDGEFFGRHYKCVPRIEDTKVLQYKESLGIIRNWPKDK